MIFKIMGIKIVISYKEEVAHKEEIKIVKEIFFKQNSKERISGTEIVKILKDATQIELQTLFKKSDLSYKLVDIFHLKKTIKINNLARYEYIKTERDCDDFSYMLQGDITHKDSDLAFGMIWGIKPNGKGHAFNWCIGTDKELWFIEPQSNKVFKPEKLWKVTLLVM